MNTINRTYKACVGFIILLIMMTACENDNDKIYLSSVEGSDFMATETDVVLSKETSTRIVLSLAWTKDAFLSVSNPNMGTAVQVSYYIQMSTSEDFSSNVIEESITDYSKGYTGAELNIVAKNLQTTPDVATPVYFRIKSVTGPNMDGPYSKTLTVNITSYLIDMSVGFILDTEKKQADKILVSPLLNGIYTGFMGAAGWSNFYLLEGDGAIWGNDAITKAAFQLSSENDDTKRWNFWFPGSTGCYYTEVNTIKKVWSALYLPSIKVTGDIQANMTFDRPNVKWTATFTATAASTKLIKLNSDGKLYDYTTSTDDAAAKSTPFAFAQDGLNIVKADKATDIAVTVPAAGTYTLVVDLSKAGAWTCSVASGTEEPETVIEKLYLPGIDDKISGNWTFDNFLKLYDEPELKYAGVLNINSNFGYTINTEKDNWNDKYTMKENGSTAILGTLEYKGQKNITAPEAGVYLVEASLLNFTYKLTAMGNMVYVSGLNDTWGFDTPLTLTTTPGVYEGNVMIDKASGFGFRILLVNGDWNLKFGGAAGKLVYNGAEIKDDASLAAGTYKMKVDIIKETYSIIK